MKEIATLCLLERCHAYCMNNHELIPRRMEVLSLQVSFIIQDNTSCDENQHEYLSNCSD